MRRVSYDEYVLRVALTLARRHRTVWSWRRWRRVCRCGAELPCRQRHKLPLNRGHWPEPEQTTRNQRAQSLGEQIQAAEHNAACARILAQAQAERIPVEEITRAAPERRWRRGHR
ncbi:hypothetical protein AWW66_16735 [Micromonospora rosaria]|uniref:Uncharacterized protein n=1 Tax=Micromonospora rosaria TaxID=47874 RepID=A0A136PQX7_9ACTN|nr:hypothetical protein [Micromonospora rosaria]KXK60840.1 hypothetical protein AWW66_16735 [Micromonospora rosaria]